MRLRNYIRKDEMPYKTPNGCVYDSGDYANMLAVAKNLLARHRDWQGLNPAMQSFLASLRDGEWTPITLRVIRPRKPLKLSVLGFNDQAGLEAAFDIGYNDAQHEWVYSAAG